MVLAQSCVRVADGIRASKDPYPFPICCDEDRSVIKRYGVWHPIGLDAWNLAHPASFLIDATRHLRYAFVGRTQFTRAPLAAILQASAASDVR